MHFVLRRGNVVWANLRKSGNELLYVPGRPASRKVLMQTLSVGLGSFDSEPVQSFRGLRRVSAAVTTRQRDVDYALVTRAPRRAFGSLNGGARD